MSEVKTAIITGASSGLGLATAQLLLDSGCRCVVTGRSLERLNQACATLAEKYPDSLLAVEADAATESGAKLPFDKARERGWGCPDYLLNNAGLAFFAKVAETELADWNNIIANNLTSVFLMSRQAVTCWQEAKRGGAIVNIASVTANMGGPLVSAYAAAKAAVIAFTKCLAKETATESIRVNCLCPGAMDTPMFHRDTIGTFVKLYQRQPEQLLRGTLAMVPMHRLVQPQEVAQVVAMLFSDQASAITGQTLNVDCGYDMR